MCDSEMHSVNPNYSQDEKIFFEDELISSLWYLSFWSHPAWFRGTKHSSLSAAAIKEWVTYYRFSVAQNKETMVQIIGSVKKVIPNSKLANYGDYSYDIDYEDMCCITEDVNIKSHILKVEKCAYAKRYDFWSSETDTSDPRDNDLCLARKRNNLIDLKSNVRSLGEWLDVLNRVLINVRRIANEAQLLDSWTETLLKFCLRFVCILRINENLAKILNSEIPFIIDYKQLRKTHISKIELQSIPQPENNEDVFLDNKSVDALWLKLSSPRIRKIWNKDTRVPFPFDSESQHSKHLIPLIKTNFLRSRQSKNIHSPRQTINIPKNMENELLGSLLHTINEFSLESDATLTKVDDTSRNYFPQAHGNWTRQLFPHSLNLNPTFVKEPVARKPWNVASIPQVSDSAVKLEHASSETAAIAMPIQFYKSVPPPTIAARFRPPCMHGQPRNRLVFMSPNSMISNSPPQQVQYKVPTAPVLSLSPVTYISQASLSPNCNAPRLSAPIYAGLTIQHNRLNVLRAPYQYCTLQDVKEPQKYQSMIEENSTAERTSIDSEAKDLKEGKQICNNPEETGTLMPIAPTVPFVQLNRGYNIPFRIQQNVGNTIGKTISTTQSVISNSQLLDSRMPMKMNYPITSYRLPTPLIKNTLPPRNHCIFPQFTIKPRFLGAVTINSLKRVHEKLFQQRHQFNYINGPSYQDIASFESRPSHLKDTDLGYENKVEKWLESISKYAETGSFIKLEELPELLSAELSDDCSKSDGGEEDDYTEPRKWQSKNTSENFQPKSSCDGINSSFNIPNNINGKSLENKANILMRKKIKRLFYEHLHLFQTIPAKLNNCKSLRRKIKIVKIYFAEINSISRNKFYFENLIKIMRMKNCFIKKIGQRKKKEFSAFKQKYCPATKSHPKLSPENNLDMHQSSLFINDISKYKILIRESQEFNTFPSKRVKLVNSQRSFFETEDLIRDERSRWNSSLNYFDSVIDELFFGANRIEEMHNGNRNKMMNAEVNGWAHFKVTVKTVMKNVISSLDTQI